VHPLSLPGWDGPRLGYAVANEGPGPVTSRYDTIP
jgi:hypothetical protein